MPPTVASGYSARMNVNGLNDEQRRRLKANLVRQRDGLDALIKRMQAVGWHTDDAMFQTILAARHALHAAVNSFTPVKQMTSRQFDPPTWAGYPKPINYPSQPAGRQPIEKSIG